MYRRFGLALLAAALLAYSLLVVWRAWPHLDMQRHRALSLASLFLILLACLAAEAIWALRSHAFLLFVAWGLSAMMAVALLRLSLPEAAHAARLLPSFVYTGLVFAAAAIFLRRAI